MDVINDNESQFLSSLQRGSRLIRRTLDTLEATKTFPGQVT